jgi:hypothetical protein
MLSGCRLCTFSYGTLRGGYGWARFALTEVLGTFPGAHGQAVTLRRSPGPPGTGERFEGHPPAAGLRPAFDQLGCVPAWRRSTTPSVR